MSFADARCFVRLFCTKLGEHRRRRRRGASQGCDAASPLGRNPHRHHAAEARPLRTRRTCSWAWRAAVNPQTYVVMAFEIPLCAARAPLPWWHASMRRRHTTRCRSRPEFLSKDFCARWQVAARAVERDARQVPSHALSTSAPRLAAHLCKYSGTAK